MDFRMPHAFARTTCARYHVSEPFKRKIKALVLKLAVELWVLFSQESAQLVKKRIVKMKELVAGTQVEESALGL